MKTQDQVGNVSFVLWSLMALAFLALAGCATQPGAYSNVQPIDGRTLHVTTKAAPWGDRSDVLKSLYSEIAKEAAMRGYAYFVINDSKSYDNVSTVHTQGAKQYSYSYNPVFNQYEARSMPQQSMIEERHIPVMEATVRLYKAGEIDPAKEGVWDVNSILAQAKDNQK